jgi:hypothetical protein
MSYGIELALLTYFSTLNSNMSLEVLYHLQLCVTEFLKCSFREFMFLSRFLYALNMAEELQCILNIVWHKNFHHNKDKIHVSTITDSQTSPAEIFTDMFSVIPLWELPTTPAAVKSRLCSLWGERWNWWYRWGYGYSGARTQKPNICLGIHCRNVWLHLNRQPFCPLQRHSNSMPTAASVWPDGRLETNSLCWRQTVGGDNIPVVSVSV